MAVNPEEKFVIDEPDMKVLVAAALAHASLLAEDVPGFIEVEANAETLFGGRAAFQNRLLDILDAVTAYGVELTEGRKEDAG